MKKKYSKITLASASVLIGLIGAAKLNSVVNADEINNVDENNQPTQVETQPNDTTSTTNDIQNTDTDAATSSDEDTSSEIENQNFNQDNQNSRQNVSLNSDASRLVRNAQIDLNSLSTDQIAQLNKINFDSLNVDTGTQFTYHQYRSLANKMINRESKYRVPYFNPKKIKNMPATHTRDAQTGKMANLDIWDSWVVQDEETGIPVNYKGYQLAIAMMGIPKKNDSHIYLLYNKYNDNNFNHWKTAGPIFGFHATPINQEWSGSATLNKDGSIQLFYTDVDTSEGDNHQKVSTVNLKLSVDKKGHVKIAKRRYRHVLFEGDGYHYQTYEQWKATNQGADNVAMRDAHVISVNGHRYLTFEASTGLENYQGSDQIYNWQNYGGTDQEALQNFLGIIDNDDMTSRASWANAALGLLRLDDDENNPSVEEVYSPLISAPMVTDEIERPDLIRLNGKYYLFATTRLNRGTGDDLWTKANRLIGDNVAMLGWVSDHLTYGYKPLNGDATVLTASVPFNWRTSTYSYYAVPVKGHSDEVLITSYMTNRGYAAGAKKRSTWAPSFLVKISADGTTKVLKEATNQGDWIYDKKSKNNTMLVSSLAKARLKGEPDPDKSGKLSKIPLKKHKKVTKKKHKKQAKKHIYRKAKSKKKNLKKTSKRRSHRRKK